MRQPRDVLHRQGLIEAEVLADRRQGSRIALLTGEDKYRIGRREARQPENADGDEECDGNHEHEATEDVLRHSVASSLISSDAFTCPAVRSGSAGCGPGTTPYP